MTKESPFFAANCFLVLGISVTPRSIRIPAPPHSTILPWVDQLDSGDSAFYFFLSCKILA